MRRRAMFAVFVGIAAAFGLSVTPAPGQTAAEPDAADESESPSVEEAIARGLEIILGMQEGDDDAEWPYQGVYRVKGEIPIGYRVGGSAIASHALLAAPGYDDDAERQAAVARATQFIIESIEHPLMAHAFESRYDVRGWGYAYGLAHLLRLKAAGRVPAALTEKAEEAVRFYIDGIVATSIPERGGWNYSRRAGFQAPGRPSPFMTGPTLLALFEAVRQGYEVDTAVIDAGIAALDASRTPTGSFMYAGDSGASSRESVPGSVGRMLVGESTLLLAGRGSVDRVRSAVDAFIVHWEWLDQRRAKTGTHVRPYGVAPYYFYFAHYFAAVAVELLPAHERDEYRRRFRTLLFSVRLEDGAWNDRVFDRSANYGTAMSVLALLMPELPAPTGYAPSAPPPAPTPAAGSAPVAAPAPTE